MTTTQLRAALDALRIQGEPHVIRAAILALSDFVLSEQNRVTSDEIPVGDKVTPTDGPAKPTTREEAAEMALVLLACISPTVWTSELNRNSHVAILAHARGEGRGG